MLVSRRRAPREHAGEPQRSLAAPWGRRTAEGVGPPQVCDKMEDGMLGNGRWDGRGGGGDVEGRSPVDMMEDDEEGAERVEEEQDELVEQRSKFFACYLLGSSHPGSSFVCSGRALTWPSREERLHVRRLHRPARWVLLLLLQHALSPRCRPQDTAAQRGADHGSAPDQEAAAVPLQQAMTSSRTAGGDPGRCSCSCAASLPRFRPRL